MRSWQRWTLVTLLVLVGVAALLVGYVYMHRPAGRLPQVLGRIPHAKYHRTMRELVSFAVGAACLLLALVLAFVGRRPRYDDVRPHDGAPRVTAP